MYKIAFSGAHGTGKTTSVADTFYNLKIKHPNKTITIICETAKECPFKINKDGDLTSQFWIFNKQMLREIEASNSYDIVISDRSVIDNIAYMRYLGYENQSEHLLEIAIDFMYTYNKINFKSIENNNFFFKDGVRDSKDIQYRKDIDRILLELYEKIFQKIPNSREIFSIN